MGRQATSEVEAEAEAMATSLRRGRMLLGASSIVAGLGLLLVSGWAHWSDWSDYRERAAEYEAGDEEIASYFASSSLNDEQAPESRPVLSDKVIERMFTTEPEYQPSALAAATIYTIPFGLLFLLGGLGMLRKARAEQRIASSDLEASPPLG